ncbi:MAG: DUF4129 domain-containing protein [Acidimicrobiales bacterium]
MRRIYCFSLALLLADLPTPDPPPGVVKDKADQILSDSQFRSGSKNLAQRVVDWLLKQIKVPFSSAAGGNTVVGFIILIVCLAALAYVISRIRFGLPASASRADAPTIDIEEDRPADVWRADALAAEAAGQWKLALRARYRWLLGELFDRQVLVNVPGRTPGEYRGDMTRALPDQSSAFATATDLFERAWYGNESTGPEENSRFRMCAEQVLTAAARVLA